MRRVQGKPIILIIDDALGNIRILTEILKGDYEILMATDGKEALEAVSSHRVDLILLDVVMPEMDGYEVCQRLKTDKKTEDIPVIFLTGKDEVLHEAKGLMLGAVDYLLKPINPKIVKIRVRTQLALHQKYYIWSEKTRELEAEIAVLRYINQELLDRLDQ